jgi:lysine-specific demethylase 8
MASVERVENPTNQEFVSNFVSKGKPVVITGAMTDWQALTEWTPERLVNRIGGREISVNQRPDGMYQRVDQVDMKLAEYMEILEDPERRERFYINGIKIADSVPELREDFTAPRCVKSEWGDYFVFWFGYNSRTINHFHPNHEALLCQVIGQKRIILSAPGNSREMYPKNFLADDFNCSFVDPHNPDLEKYPMFEHAKLMECTLDPGDMLFIPIYWWHGIYGLELSGSLTHFWPPSLRNYRFPEPGIRFGAHAARVYWHNLLLKFIRPFRNR